jgi:hypothetical protein
MEGIDKSEGFVLRGYFCHAFAWITDLIWVCFDSNIEFRRNQAGPGRAWPMQYGASIFNASQSYLSISLIFVPNYVISITRVCAMRNLLGLCLISYITVGLFLILSGFLLLRCRADYILLPLEGLP